MNSGCFSANVVDRWKFKEGKVNSTNYIKILSAHLINRATDLGMTRCFVFKQDNDTEHKANLTKKCLKDVGYTSMI